MAQMFYRKHILLPPASSSQKEFRCVVPLRFCFEQLLRLATSLSKTLSLTCVSTGLLLTALEKELTGTDVDIDSLFLWAK